MKNKFYLRMMVLIVGLPSLLVSIQVFGAELDEVQQVGEKKLVAAEQSQIKIDKIVEGAQERLIQYRSLLKQIEGLKIYNEQLSTQVASQENLIIRFDESITQV
ncbi:MAG: DUF3450 family protein, partial [Proteobacteria bacterium]|nr:DUF3450 family protein [Pseudomonadota bacterium]